MDFHCISEVGSSLPGGCTTEDGNGCCLKGTHHMFYHCLLLLPVNVDLSELL